jgi:foldase protein PrsA
VSLGVAVFAGLAPLPSSAQAQGFRFGSRAKEQAKAAAATPSAPATTPGTKPSVSLNQINVPGVKQVVVPVQPTDAIATVSGRAITRQQLADEAVARKGKEILDTLINRVIIQMALEERKLEVTAAEIDQEIDNVAQRIAGIGREAWLRTLDKERGISPVQYARDIIYPALALRKLSEGRVQVTEKDIQDSFELQYGTKLRCRMIMLDKLATAQEVWDSLKRNPGGFERVAQEKSMDTASRAMGGLLPEPIRRHAYPQNVSDAAFRSLVDGDPADKDPSHKPKDGDISGIIQVSQSMWVIFRREGVIPAAEGVSLKDPAIRKQIHDLVYDVKQKEMMGIVFQELYKNAEIENKLIGSVKLANEEQNPDYPTNPGEVKLMGEQAAGGAPRTADASTHRTSATATPGGVKVPPPAALPPEATKQFSAPQPKR